MKSRSTGSGVGLDKKRLRREIEADRRAKRQARDLELTEAIKLARIAKTEAVKGVRMDCRLKRQELRESCALRATRARIQGTAEVEAGKRTRAEERKYEKMIRAGDKPSRLQRTTRTTARERAQESDDAVRSNLPAEMVPIFNAVRKAIKPTARKSRTESFLEWAEENSDEVFAMMSHQADRDLAALLREQEQLHKEMKRTRTPRRRRSLAAELAEAVPF